MKPNAGGRETAVTAGVAAADGQGRSSLVSAALPFHGAVRSTHSDRLAFDPKASTFSVRPPRLERGTCRFEDRERA